MNITYHSNSISMGVDSMGEYSKGEYSKGSKGELQFALTSFYQSAGNKKE